MLQIIIKHLLALIAAGSLVQPLQADIILTDEPESFTTLLQAQARRGRNGWESKLFTPGADPELDARGAPFWNPNRYYQFGLDFDSGAGSVSWWIDVNRNGKRSADESLLVADPSMLGQSVNYVQLYLEGRSNFTEQAFVRGLEINGESIPGTFESGLGISDNFLTDSNGIEWGQLSVTGEMRLSWDRTTRGGTQERPRIWISVGNGINSVPEPSSIIALFGSMGLYALRRRRC